MSETAKNKRKMLSARDRVCPLCKTMFTGVRPGFSDWTPRQQNWEELQAAATAGCYICGWIKHTYRDLKPSQQPLQYKSSYKMEFIAGDATCCNCIRTRINGVYELVLDFVPVTEAGVFDDHSGITDDARKWIDECKANHEQCCVSNHAFRPTRLVQIISPKWVRLISSVNLRPDEELNYVAFSHCWGNVERLELETKNASQLFAGFETDILPQTYKDAIATCVQLRYRFIWIDSLCIFQDSRSDWQQEANMMGSVYANADLNLCAASAVDSSQSMFPDRDHNLMMPLDITSQWTGEEERELRIVSDHLFHADVTRSPLRQRAWAFQEWFLSKRSLIVGGMQAWWQCRGKLACETFPNGVLSENWKASAEAMKEMGMSSGSSWSSLTMRYAYTALTREEDRLIAFSGVAQAFRASQKSTDRYAAGLWYAHLPRSLAWENVQRQATTTRSATYKAPSWSWLSLDGPYQLFIPTGENYSKENDVEQCSLDDLWLHYVDDSHDTGLLRGGAIQLCGHLIGPATRNPNGQLSEGFLTDTYCEDFVETDRAQDWRGDNKVELQIRFDERDQNYAPIVSYLDNLQPGYTQGLVEGATRQAMSFEDADGLIYLFHTHSKLEHEEGGGLLEGIILYQPPHQDGAFHRIGCYRIVSSAASKLGRARTLGDRYPKRSILIL